MNFHLVKAAKEDIRVMEHLMQLYIYDFSEFVDRDVNEDGLFAPYPGLREYWQDENHKFPYFIKQEKTYVGFVLVRRIETAEKSFFSVAEFFVMRKYRRHGIGRSIAQQVFDMHKGQWEVFQRETNKPAQFFWNKVIAEYTKGQFSERLEGGKLIQQFENSLRP